MSNKLERLKQSIKQVGEAVKQTATVSADLIKETVKEVKAKDTEPTETNTEQEDEPLADKDDKLSEGLELIKEGVTLLGVVGSGKVRDYGQVFAEKSKEMCNEISEKSKEAKLVAKHTVEEIFNVAQDAIDGEQWIKTADVPTYSKHDLDTIKKKSKEGVYMTLEEYDEMVKLAIESPSLVKKQTAMVVVLLKKGVLGSKARDIRNILISDVIELEGQLVIQVGNGIACLTEEENELVCQILRDYELDKNSYLVGDFAYVSDAAEQRKFLEDKLLVELLGVQKAKFVSLKSIYISLAVQFVADGTLEQMEESDYSLVCPEAVNFIISEAMGYKVALSAVEDVLHELAIMQSYK